MTLPPRLRVLALAAAIATSFASASTAAANRDSVATVLPNPGFETDHDGNGVPDGWVPIGGDVRTDAASAHSGSRSLRVTGADAAAAASAVRVAVPSEVYEYAALAKLDNVDGAFLRAVFRSDRGRVLATRDSPVLSGTRGWSRLLLTAATPDDAATVSVELHQRGAGVTWFDDVWVAAKTSANLLKEGSAERHDGTTPPRWTARSTHSTAVTVPNADIESAGSGANPASWVQMTWKGTGTRSWDGTVARSGSHSLKIVGQPAGLTGWRMQDYPVISEGEYRFSVWVKANGTINSGAAPTIIFYNAAGQTIGADRVVTTPAGTYDWTQAQSTVIAPKGAVKARFDLRLNDAGTVWFDDVSISRRELAPGVGDGLTARWDATQPYDGQGALALGSEDANGEVFLQSAPVAIAPLERYTVSGALRTADVTGGGGIGGHVPR